METEALPNFTDIEEGEILCDDPEELYIPLERPHISTNAVASTSLLSTESDEESAVKDSSSDPDTSTKNMSTSKIKRKALPIKTKLAGGKKKNYNIWSSDIQTEVLTNSLVDCNVDQDNDRCRDIESYNYKLKHLNNVNDSKNSFMNKGKKNRRQYSSKSIHDGVYQEDTVKAEDTKKQDKNEYLRSGKKNKRQYGKRRHDGSYMEDIVEAENTEKQNECVQYPGRNILCLSTTVENSEEDIARDIANKLCETKEELILRALNILGKEFVISLFEETKKIEGSGGMMVMNGTRRRTPGGVFFYLLKVSESVPREKINLVLSQDKKARTDEKKLKSKSNRQLQAEKLKKSLREDDFPTLLSRTELAIKEFKARKLEDSTEVKNPPPSPATDGKECSSDGEEQKEGSERKCREAQILTAYDSNLFTHEECDMDVF